MAEGYRLEELARHVGGEVQGDPDRRLRGIATLDGAGPVVSDAAPPLASLAALPDARIRAVLTAPHEDMRGIDLDNNQMNEIIGFIGELGPQ